MSDIHEPLQQYRDEFRAAFARNAEEAFDSMQKQSGVDEAANEKTCGEIDSADRKIADSESRISVMWLLLALCIIGSLALLLPVVFYTDFAGILSGWGLDDETWTLVLAIGLCIIGATGFILTFTLFKRRIEAMKAEVEKIREKREKLLREAFRQMAPLNALFSWDIPTKLISKTVPSIEFDPYFNAARLQQISSEFGYGGYLNEDSSVLFAHSGEIKGNPFVIATLRKFQWGTKVYTGSKTIYWTERERDTNGQWHTVTRSQTLFASVEKPCPEFGNKTFLMYANEAAPNLSFSRTPEGLSDEGSKFGRKRKLRRLQKFSRKLDDNSDYTLMTNEEFEVLFSTTDRDNEVEYRLLFTPLAQTALLELMKDRAVGYGDDFSLVKTRMINVVYPEHLRGFSLDTDPERWKGYRLRDIKRRFISENEAYFKAIYFAFAPLLSIPLYQQTRTRKEIYGEDLIRDSSFWEWEAIANYRGEDRYAHPSCITENILKASLLRGGPDGKKTIRVSAHGFKGTRYTDYVSVWGGDGHCHRVPVDWIQYDSVCRESDEQIEEMPESDKEVIRCDSYPTTRLRRRILLGK